MSHKIILQTKALIRERIPDTRREFGSLDEDINTALQIVSHNLFSSRF